MENKKIKLFLDADDTILKSSKTVVDIINKKFNISPPKTEKDVKDWKYRSIYHQCTNEIINEIYDSDEFFENVTLDPDFKNFYLEYEECFEWYIVTKGHKQNLKHKKTFFEKHLPKATLICCEFISKNNERYDKSHVNMEYGIQIDDRTDCLTGTNANVKILMKNNKDVVWNKTDRISEFFYITNEWKEIIEILKFAYENPETFMGECLS